MGYFLSFKQKIFIFDVNLDIGIKMRTNFKYWIVLLVAFIFLPTSVSKAQLLLLAKEHTGQISIGPGFFSSDAGKDGVFQFYNPRIAVGFSYAYRMHDRWAVKAAINYGLAGEKDGNWRPHRGWEVSTHLVDFSGAIQFFILKRNVSGSCPDFYIAAGVGGIMSVNPKVSQPNYELGMTILPEVGITKQEAIDKWNAVHEEQRTLSSKENPNDVIQTDKKVLVAPMIPLSIGATWGIGKRFLLGVDYTIRISTNDYLDNLNPIGSWYPDMYSSLSFTVGYILKTDCYTCYSALSKPKFRKTKASSGYWF